MSKSIDEALKQYASASGTTYSGGGSANNSGSSKNSTSKKSNPFKNTGTFNTGNKDVDAALERYMNAAPEPGGDSYQQHYDNITALNKQRAESYAARLMGTQATNYGAGIYDAGDYSPSQYQSRIDLLTAEKNDFSNNWAGTKNPNKDRTYADKINEYDKLIEDARAAKWAAEGDEKYSNLSRNSDYGTLSKKIDESLGKTLGITLGDKYYGAGDDVYAYINNVGGRRDRAKEGHNQGTAGLDKYDYMTEEQIANYNYLYQKEGKKSANDYLDYISYELNNKRASEFEKNTQDWINEDTGSRARNIGRSALASAISVPENLMSGAGLADIAIQNISRNISGEYRPIDYNTLAMQGTLASSTIRGTIAQNIADKTGRIKLSEEEHPVLSKILNGKSLGDVYQLGMSMADSRALGLAVGPGASHLLGGAAGSQGILDALEKGADDRQALSMGVLNGLFEDMFEYISLDKLLNGNTGKFWSDLLANTFVEGSEELSTSLFNTLADISVMAEKSDWQRSVQEYINAGLSEKEAYKATLRDTAISMGWDFVGGAIMGGLSSAGVSALNSSSYGAENTADLMSEVKARQEAGFTVEGADSYADALAKRQEKYDAQGKGKQASLTRGEATRLGNALLNSYGGREEYIKAITQEAEAAEAEAKAEAEKTAARRKAGLGEGSSYSVNKGDATISVLNSDEAGNDIDGETTDFRVTGMARENGRNVVRFVNENGETESVAVEDAGEAIGGDAGRFIRRLNAELGEYAPGAYELYEDGQDVDDYITLMDRAINLYAKNGADVRNITQGVMAETLTPSQLLFAQSAGNRLNTAERAEANRTAAELKQAVASAREASDVVALSRTRRQIEGYIKSLKQTRQQLAAALTGLETGTDEYNSISARIRALEAKIASNESLLEGVKEDIADAQKREHKGKKGSVSLNGGIVGTSQLSPVKSELSNKQKAAVEMAEALADVLPIRFTFFEGDAKDTQGLFIETGEIFVNINSGMAINKVLAASTISHELTHFIRQNSPADYIELRDYLVGKFVEKNGQEKFDGIISGRVREVMSEGVNADEAYDRAVEEFVCNACEDMLMDSKAVQRLAYENMSLFEKVKKWVERTIAKIKAAYEDLDTFRAEAVFGRTLDGLQEIWDNALVNATRNFNATTGRNLTNSDVVGMDIAEADGVVYQKWVTEGETYDWLQEQEKTGNVIHTYKTLQIIDGKLYSPMAAREKGEDGKKRLKTPNEIGVWMESEGRQEDVKWKGEKRKYDLDKGNGKTTGGVAYNPYQHSSNLVLNDQFDEAWNRPNLVTVECIIPSSELTSGYQAPGAKDAVGAHDWKAGPVANAIKDKSERIVYLSRWLKPIRILSDAETASMYKDLLEGTDAKVPFNVVTPSLLRELEKAGVPIDYRGTANYRRNHGDVGRNSYITGSEKNRSLSAGDTSTSAKVGASASANNIAQQNGQRKAKYQAWDEETWKNINESMTMDQARTMIQKAFKYADPNAWKDEGEALYKNGDEWIRDVGVGEVAMYIENEYVLQDKYINSNEHIINEEFAINDILEAYLKGTLTGGERKKPVRLNTSTQTGYEDSRFYAPKNIPVSAGMLETANLKATSKNKDVVNEARKNILLAAHNGNALQDIGITASELNKKLRTWSRYPASAREISMRINSGVAPENQWTGIQNSSLLSEITMTDEDIQSMVKEIKGNSSEYQRNYIGRTMLALDTHIDWSGLTFEFLQGNVDPSRSSVRGKYINSSKTIKVGRSSGENTVAHEMGHALDYKWAEDLFDSKYVESLTDNKLREDFIRTESGKRFYRNFKIFIDDLTDVNSNYSAYSMDPGETFARFVAKFVEWTRRTAGAPIYNEYLTYDDRFTPSQYIEFARLLQEKAMVDADEATEGARFQKWSEDQFSLFDEETGRLHPELQRRIDDAEKLKADLKRFFSGGDYEEYGITDELIEDSLDINLYAPYNEPDADVESVFMALNDISKELSGETQEHAYELMRRLTEHMRPSYAAWWQGYGSRNEKAPNEAFASWNRERDGFEDFGRTRATRSRTLSDKEKAYMERGFRAVLNDESASAGLKEDARRNLKRLENRNAVWYQKWEDGQELFDMVDGLTDAKSAEYQKWSEGTGDTAKEAANRDRAFATMKAENENLRDIVTSLQKELKAAAKLQAKTDEKLERAERQTRRTETPEVRLDDAKKIARSLIKRFESGTDANDIAVRIKELGDYIVSVTGETVDYDTIKSMARDIAYEVLSDVNVPLERENLDLDDRQAIASAIKGRRFTVMQQDKGELDVEGGYNDFRKKNFGKFTLVNEGGESIDSAYTELQNTYGTVYFPEVNSPGEMIAIMADLVDNAEPVMGNPYEDYMAEATEQAANDIIYDAIGETLRQMPETLADKLAKAKAVSRAELRAARNAAKEDRSAAVAKERAAARARYEALQERSAKRIAEIKAEGKARVREVRAHEKAEKWKKVKSIHDYYLEKEERAREARNEAASVTQYKERIIRKATSLMDRVTANTGKKHVPEALRAPLAEFLSTIRFDSKRSLAGGPETQNDLAMAERMSDLADVLAQQKNYQDGAQDAADIMGAYLDLPDGIIEQMRDIARNARDYIRRAGGDYTINTMNSLELRALDQTLDVITAAVNGLNRFHENNVYNHVDEAGASTIRELGELPEISARLRAEAKRRGLSEKDISDFLSWDNTVPIYAFKRYGKAGEAMFDEIIRGWGKMAVNAEKVIEFAQSAYSEKEAKAWLDEKKALTYIDAAGKPVSVKMSVSELMTLYELLKRNQARQHIFGGGIQVPETSSDLYAVDGRIIAELEQVLTQRQKDVADALQKYMQNDGGELGNEVTRARWGISSFGEEHYFPIESVSSVRNADGQEAAPMRSQDLYRLMNMGFTKSLNKYANNAVVIRPIFDVFANHMADMVKYNALTMPMLDAMKWYNYRERTDVEGSGTAFLTDSVQRSIERAYGKGANGYYINFMKDMNGVNEGGRGEGRLKGLISNYKVAQIGFNLRVVMQQPTSIARAALNINPKYLLEGVVTKGDREEMLKHSGIAVWKIALGFYDVNINSSMRQQIKHTDSLKDKVQNASTWAAGKADEVTWAAMWRACKAEQRDLGYTGEELIARTADRFEHLMLTTQVMDSTISRSQNMRSTTIAMSEYTGFMSEPTMSYNTLLDAYMDFRGEMRKKGFDAAVKSKGGRMIKAVLVWQISEAIVSAVEAIADAARDDDEYETFLQKWLEHWAENYADNANPLKLVPIVSDAYELIRYGLTQKGYSNEDSMATAGLKKFLTFLKDAAKTITGEGTGKKTPWGVIYEGLQAGGMLIGIPAAPVAREVTALHNGFVTIYNDTLGIEYDDRLDYWKTYDEGEKAAIKSAVENGYLDDEAAANALVEADAYDSTEKASQAVYEWSVKAEGYDSKYGKLYEAVMAGDDSTVSSVKSELQSHGYTDEQINGTIKQNIEEWYTDPATQFDRQQALNALTRYAGMEYADADSKLSYWFYKSETPNCGNTQKTLGPALRTSESRGIITRAEARKIWQGCNLGWVKSYDEWLSEN